jgi:hypothetical protein
MRFFAKLFLARVFVTKLRMAWVVRAALAFARSTHSVGDMPETPQVLHPTLPSTINYAMENQQNGMVLPSFHEEDHAAMKKQWQTNLEIDLLKSAWIQKDREHPANVHPLPQAATATPPNSAASGAQR